MSTRKALPHLALILVAILAVATRGGDATLTLDSADGSSAFRVLDSGSAELIRVGSNGRLGLGLASPAYALDVRGDINLTGDLRLNGVLLTLGTGTVTSVTGDGGVTGLTLGGGPITTTGTLTLGGTLALANGGTGATTAAAARTNLGLGTAATLAATSANTPSTVVGRDPSGNFIAGTITAALTGTAGKATNLVGGNSTTLYGAMHYQAGVDATTLVTPNTTTTKKFLRMTGSGTNGAIPAWDTVVAGDIPTLNQNTTGTAANVTGTFTVGNGGTGLTSYAVGDLPYGSGGSTLSRLTAVATGNALISGGATTAPSWGKIGLTTHVSGILPVANGGTGATTLTANKVLVGNGASTPLQPTYLHWDNTYSRLGVGTTTPNYTVDVSGDVNVTGAFRVNGTAVGGGTIGGSGTADYLPRFTNGTTLENSAIYQSPVAGSPVCIINAGFMINTTAELNSYASKLNILYTASSFGMTLKTTASAGNPISFLNSAGTQVGRVATTAGGTAYLTSSDRRLKENITPTHFGLADLMKVQPVDYNFIADAAKTVQTGFIAQDLDTVFPDAVTAGGDDAKINPWSVDYGRVTPLLVKAVQDLKVESDSATQALIKRCVALETENAALKAQQTEILKRLAALEAK